MIKLKRLFPAILISCSVLIISGCGADKGEGRIFATFEHEYGYALDIEAILEGNDGRSIDAASVILRCPDSSVLLMDYDSTKCRYTASISSPPSGDYSVTASSLGLVDTITMTVRKRQFSPGINNPSIPCG